MLPSIIQPPHIWCLTLLIALINISVEPAVMQNCVASVTTEIGFSNGYHIKTSIVQWVKIMIALMAMDHESQERVFNYVTN